MGVTLVAGTLAMCSIAAIVLARDFAKREEEEDESYDMGYYALSESDEVSSNADAIAGARQRERAIGCLQSSSVGVIRPCTLSFSC